MFLKKYFLLSIIIFLTDICFSQNQSKIDSLVNIANSGKKDTNTVLAMTNLCNKYLHILPDKALNFGERALLLAEEINFQKGKGNALSNLGNVFMFQGNYEKALMHYQQSLKIREKIFDKKGTGISLNNIGEIYRYKGDYGKALEYYQQAVTIFEEIEFKIGVSSVLANMGIIYGEQKNYDKAIQYYKEGLKIQEEIDDKRGMSNSFNNMGIIYKEKGDNTQAIKFYFTALKIRREIEDKQGMAISYGNIGTIYYEKGDYTQAVELFFKALKIKEEINDKQGMALTYNNIGDLFLKIGNTSEAKKELLKALSISKEIQEKPILMQTYFTLAICDSTLNNFKSAYYYQKLYSELKDSIFNEESSKQIAEMQTKYETEKKELQIENLNKDNAIKETEIKKQNVQKIAFASGFLLMLILAFVIFRGYNQKKKANEIITAQKTEVEKQKEIVEGKNNSLQIAYKHIEEKNTEILDSIRYAKRIQEAILPPQKLVKQYLENSFILYKPKDIVAGDFYWMHTPSPLERGQGGEVFFACCDCTGHGVPGAFVSILGYNGLNRCVKEFGLTQPAAILDKLCELVDEAFSKSETDIKDGMDIALCKLSITNPERVQNPFGVIQYAGAGNSLYHIRNRVLTEYSPDKQPIGKFAYRHPFTNHEIPLQKGDAVYVFTDGYADQFGGPKGKKFKYSQFEKLLLSIQEKSMTEQREILNETIDKWKRELEQVDDICIIGVRV